MTYTSKRVSAAANLLNRGSKAVTVATQAEAEELYLTQYLSKGYKNTTGLTTLDMKDKFLFPNGKAGTYHWDFYDTQHAGLPHLQIHDDQRNIIRIFIESMK
jgi:hypothetical protein